MKNKKFAIYARVSTKLQDATSQLLDLRKYAEQRDWQIVHEFVDIGISGSKEQRPQLDALMDASRKRIIDGVLVFRFDRVARSTVHLLRILDEFRTLGIDFVSFQENIDTSSPLGSAMFTIVAAVAQLERDILKERVSAGIRKARHLGKTLGRPKSVVNMEEVMGLRKKGMALRQIGEKLGVSKDTILRFLTLYQKCSQNRGADA